MSDEAEQRPAVRVESVRPFRELFDALSEAGFDPQHQAPMEQRAAPVVEAIAIYAVEKLADPQVERLTAAVRGWVESWLRPLMRERAVDSSRASITIYGPRGEVLSRVPVDED